MIQHTMQEIADTFGCIVSKDKIDSEIILWSRKPVFTLGCYRAESDADIIRIPISSDLVSDAATHDWRVLVEPTGPAKCAHCGEVLSVTVNSDAIVEQER